MSIRRSHGFGGAQRGSTRGGLYASPLERTGWLLRRLSRSDPREFPYRLGSLAFTLIRRAGLFDASRVPEPSAHRFAAPWVAIPRQGISPRQIAFAEETAAGRLALLGVPVPFESGHPRWNGDPRTAIELPLEFGPFLDFRHLGGDIDIKFLWEVNRHLWWVPVAQAYASTGDLRYLSAIGGWLDSWLRDCPYPLGPNWSSPVEHGIRLINWSLVWHLIGGHDSPLFGGPIGNALRSRWLCAIYQHMHSVQANYSRYTSASNHLIGEAAGVYVGARTWPLWRTCEPWAREAMRILEEEAAKQFSPEGVNREQSFCYHRFSLEFLVAALLCGDCAGDAFRPAFIGRVEAAFGFLAACIDTGGNVPGYGDGDDGQVFSLTQGEELDPHRTLAAIGARLFDRPEFETAGKTDTSCTWLEPGLARHKDAGEGIARRRALPRDFSASGFVILGRDLGRPNEARALFDVGPLGYNRIAAHGHADLLALTVSIAGRAFLVDSGTYCYNTAPDLRRYFRSTTAHNTLMVDGQSQSVYGGSFLWLRDADAKVERLELGEDVDRVVASHNGYRRLHCPARHRRAVEFDKRQVS